MAAPHVAGAFSVLREYMPTAPVEDLLEALRTIGTPVDDNRSGGTVTALPRINVYQAIQALAASRQSLFIRNNGSSELQVSSIHADPASPWLSFNPAAPLTVSQGQLETVELVVDFGTAPGGTTNVNLVIESNDPDESPYPGGVELTVINATTCNLTTVSDVTINSVTSYDACETLVIGPSVTAGSTAEVSLSAGSEVEMLPEFRIGVGATLDTQVCGQSLCATHDDPMPYGCHSCVNQICDVAPTCCNTAFDQSCLDMVETTCGLACDP